MSQYPVVRFNGTPYQDPKQCYQGRPLAEPVHTFERTVDFEDDGTPITEPYQVGGWMAGDELEFTRALIEPYGWTDPQDAAEMYVAAQNTGYQHLAVPPFEVIEPTETPPETPPAASGQEL